MLGVYGMADPVLGDAWLRGRFMDCHPHGLPIDPMIEIGPTALVAALAASSALYIHSVHAPRPKKELSLPMYLLARAVAGIVGLRSAR
jgi:hypothetical protein